MSKRRPGSADKRATGRRGVLDRVWFRRENPLCARCKLKGIIRAGTEIDHIVPLLKGGDDSWENKMNLCRDCHAEKTAQDMGYRLRPKIGPDGYPIA